MIQIKSPNYSSREGQGVLAVVIHIGDGTKDAIVQTFKNPASKVSAHYLVYEQDYFPTLSAGAGSYRIAETIQFVDESQAAWANGLKVNPTAKVVLENPNVNPNSFTISIENEGFGNKDISELMYQKNAKLVKDICQRHNLPINKDTVIGHRSIRADKACPGKIDVNKIIELANQTEETKIKTLLQKIIDLYTQIIIKLKLKK